MPQRNIRFRHDNGTCSITLPPRVGVRPADAVVFSAGPQTKVTLRFGNRVQMILTPRPPNELVLESSQPGNGNASARFTVAGDAHQKLGLTAANLPASLDLGAHCSGDGEEAVVNPQFHGDDIIMELC